ncbi:hypothetical protein LSTR_LSTR008586 [Laodelphax striatellus]|uniref:Uncharacterized protein n=1 Tax=Laodelphax striatellus TaxID=195883 RepID=A0A482WVQ4_LAOST|nr:hypothetical protein LSTR_LSTR008586 [Laodelphax striatellus]
MLLTDSEWLRLKAREELKLLISVVIPIRRVDNLEERAKAGGLNRNRDKLSRKPFPLGKIHGQKNIAVNVVERGREVEEESREIWEETMREEELSATDASSLDSQI